MFFFHRLGFLVEFGIVDKSFSISAHVERVLSNNTVHSHYSTFSNDKQHKGSSDRIDVIIECFENTLRKMIGLALHWYILDVINHFHRLNKNETQMPF